MGRREDCGAMEGGHGGSDKGSRLLEGGSGWASQEAFEPLAEVLILSAAGQQRSCLE